MAEQADQGFNPQPTPKAAPESSAEQPPPPHAAQPAAQQSGAAPSDVAAENTEAALDQVTQAAEKVVSTTTQQANQQAGVAGLEMTQFDQQGNAAQSNGSSATGLERLDDVELDVQIELGRTRMYVQDVLRLNADSVIELERAAGDPVDVFVNGRLIARGEVLVLNDNFCVRINEVIEQETSLEG